MFPVSGGSCFLGFPKTSKYTNCSFWKHGQFIIITSILFLVPIMISNHVVNLKGMETINIISIYCFMLPGATRLDKWIKNIWAKCCSILGQGLTNRGWG